MAWPKPSKETVIKSMLYAASNEQSAADRLTASYQSGERAQRLVARDAKLSEARRWAVLNGVLDLFQRMTGLD